MSQIDLYIPSWIASASLAATGNFYLFRGATTTAVPSASNPPEMSRGAAGFRSGIISWQWAATSTPAGNFKFEGCNQTGYSTDSWEPIYLDANKVYGTFDGAIYAHTGANIITVAGSGAGDLSVHLDIMPRFLRLVWTRTSGGSATGLTAAQATLRPF